MVESPVDLESSDSIPELADYTTESLIVSRLPLSNMFNILSHLEFYWSRSMADWQSGYGPLEPLESLDKFIIFVWDNLFSLLIFLFIHTSDNKTTSFNLI